MGYGVFFYFVDTIVKYCFYDITDFFKLYSFLQTNFAIDLSTQKIRRTRGNKYYCIGELPYLRSSVHTQILVPVQVYDEVHYHSHYRLLYYSTCSVIKLKRKLIQILTQAMFPGTILFVVLVKSLISLRAYTQKVERGFKSESILFQFI